MEFLDTLLARIVGYVWNTPLVVLLVGTGLLLTILLGGVQFRAFFHSIQVIRGKFDDQRDPGEVSHFQALTTALSATVGLGNIAGVAIAVHTGGPGATFWMIVTGLVGMVTKYSECSLAVMFRRVDLRGVVHGGPMYYIEHGLGRQFKPLALFFAFACMVSSFGAANMFQVNQVASILNESFGVSKLLTGLALGTMTAVVIIGGIRRIGRVTSFLVPFMGLIYVSGALLVILSNLPALPGLLWEIVSSAFSGTAATGAFAGIAVKEVLIQGVRRACFSNEAGLGSAAVAHSAARTDEPVREGVVALLEPFIDTVVICTMTALVILISGHWRDEFSGVVLTANAFNYSIPGFGTWFVPIAVFLFAYSTVLSWSYYGERAVDYMVGEKGIIYYKILFCIVCVIGAVWTSSAVLNFSDIMLGLMAAPNLFAVWLLFPKLRAASRDYFGRLRSGQM